RRVRTMRLLEAPPCERRKHEPDRDVEPEDPVPRDPVDDGAADERPERYRETADPAPDPEREPAPLRRHARREDRQRQRRDDRPADALRSPRGVEHRRARREGGEGGRAGEEEQPESEQPATTEAVAERR